MQDHLLQFVGVLRERGIAVSVAESLDALRAVGVVGVEREPLRETLAACLIKDEADRLLFDTLFEEHFPLIGPRPHRGRHGSGARGLGGEGAGGTTGSGQSGGMCRSVEPSQGGDDVVSSRRLAQGAEWRRRTVRSGARRTDGHTRAPRDSEQPQAEECKPRHAPASTISTPDRAAASDGDSATANAASSAGPSDHDDDGCEGPSIGHCRRERELLRKPFREYTPYEVETSDALVALLARELRGRLARRLRVSRRGRLDFRRTLRRAASTGGVPMHLLFRGPRPGRPRLTALCDVSGSVSAVSKYLLGLIAPAARYFRSVETFVYVDHLCPASFENGHLVPHRPLDLYAPSNFGQVLVEYCAGPVNRLDRNSVFLILGDGRNNRRPPRARLLADIRGRVRAVYWLNPEMANRWNSGDSVIAQYARHCTAVFECCNLSALMEALGRIL